MVDEIDVLQSDNSFRPQLEDVIDYYFMFPPKNRCMVTATMKEFSNPLLKTECKFSVPWLCNTARTIRLLYTNNITQVVCRRVTLPPYRENTHSLQLHTSNTEHHINLR